MASKYIKGVLLGEGTWGSVYQASRRTDGQIVAVKRIKPMDPLLGINFTALREIKFLREIRHTNVVDLKDVFISGGVLHLVMEFCPYDLSTVIYDKSLVLRTPHHKAYLHMMLRGVDCLHSNFVLHRDLKPANLLFGLDGQLKLADFGLARSLGSPEKMTAEVVTRWYRSPELLFGAQYYSYSIDIWALGCIFAEMLLRTPLMPGDSDLEQLQKIFNLVGTPNDVNWPNAKLLPGYVEFETREKLDLLPIVRSAQAVDLLNKMLCLNPLKRISAKQALQHPYFTETPLPCDIGDLPLPAGVTEIIKATNQANHTQQHVHQGHGGNKGIAGVKREMEEETGQSHSKKLKTSL